MNLTDLVRKLESQLKTAEKYTREYDTQAVALRKKLESVAGIVAGGSLNFKKGWKSLIPKSARGSLSSKGRAKIVAAQRKRWAAFRKGKKK